MATSGKFNRSIPRDTLIRDAYFQAGKLAAEGQSLSPDRLEYGSRSLANILSHLKTQEPNLFLLRDIVVFLQRDKQKYILGDGDRACYQTDFVKTYTSVAAISGASTVTLLTVTGLTTHSFIGIQNGLDLFWVQILNIVGNVVTLLSPLPADIASSVIVYGYTDNIAKPMLVQSMVLNEGNDGNIDINMTAVSRADWFRQPAKTVQAIPTNYAYTPYRDNGELYLWTMPISGIHYIKGLVALGIETMDAANDDFSLPAEWILPVQNQLALHIAAQDLPIELKTALFKQQAEAQFNNCIGLDSEDADLRISLYDEDYA